MAGTTTLRFACVFLMAGCASSPGGSVAPGDSGSQVRIAHLGSPGGDAAGFAALRSAFMERNPGYDVRFHGSATWLARASAPRVVFVQAGETQGLVLRPAGAASSDLAVGDIILLRPGQELRTEAPVDFVAFSVESALPAGLPTFVRPDWDPQITDTPGGCATETGAYRRVLLTWLERNGPYIFHGLNAHRVRIMDSFTHYHPRVDGFDEFYLVQMVQPGARILTSEAVAAIEARTVGAGDTAALFRSTELFVGDLVYLPRGTIHRGLDGVLAQVITTPGFRPGAEIGVDHHLRAINESLGLTGDRALPFHLQGSQGPVVR